MGSLAEYRDNETGEHIKRTQLYIKALCQALLQRSLYTHIINPEYIELFFKSAPLHDIGKVGIRDAILLKPGKLTVEEFEEMKRHASFGEEVITRLIEKTTSNTFLSLAKEIAGGHHEKWDGTGYPRGLKAESIPLSARIMAIADVYDALVSERVYKKGYDHLTAISYIHDASGSHFDPTLVSVFMEIHETFQNIAQLYKD